MQIPTHVYEEIIIHYALVFTSIRNILEVLVPAKHLPAQKRPEWLFLKDHLLPVAGIDHDLSFFAQVMSYTRCTIRGP